MSSLPENGAALDHDGEIVELVRLLVAHPPAVSHTPSRLDVLERAILDPLVAGTLDRQQVGCFLMLRVLRLMLADDERTIHVFMTALAAGTPDSALIRRLALLLDDAATGAKPS